MDPGATTRDAEGGFAPLLRQLGTVDAVAIIVGIVVGSGVFTTPSGVAAAASSPPAAAALWLAGGLVALCGALCYAEAGARIPQAGGFFVFYRAAWGDALAFVAGWTALLVTYPASIAAIAHVFGDYLGQAVPALAGRTREVAIAVIALAGGVNALGVRGSAWTLRLLTAVKVASIALVCGAAVVAGGRFGDAATTAPAATGLAPLLFAAMGILWAFDGWSDTPLIAGELRDPARTLGRTVAAALGMVTILYVAVQLAIGALLPNDVAARSEHVFADAVAAGLGTGAGRVVALLVVLSTGAAVNACLFTAARIPLAMARGGMFPRWFGEVGARTGAPFRAVAVLTAATAAHAALGRFDELLALFTFAVWIFYALSAIALLRMRRRGVGEPLDWRAPGGVVPPAVVVLVAAGMTSWLLVSDTKRAAVGLAMLLAGFPAFAIWRAIRARTA